MNQMKLMQKFFPLGLLVLFGAIASTAATTNTKPNLIIIMTDDQGYADVGFNGCKDIPTPNLDSLAKNGVHFPNGYVTYAVCSPSRAGMLTGRYQQRFGHERNPEWEPLNPNTGLPLTETTLADTLGNVGYKSGLIGKWHLGAHPKFHPLNRGFNEFFGMLGGGHHYFPDDLTIKDAKDAKDEGESYRLWIMRDHTPVRTTNYLTDEFSDEAVRFIERHKSEPFFLYLAYNAPHTPMQASEKYLARFPDIQNPKRRTYAAMVSAVDDGVGKLLATLRALNLETNTLVVFLSDNGGAVSANAASNRPLRGEKSSPWEGGIRVPFAAQWPAKIPKGLVYEQPVISLDIFATIAAEANAPVNPDRPLDGVNLVPYLTGKKSGPPHEAIFLRMFDRGTYAVRSGDFKLVILKTGATTELFNLHQDIGESKNIISTHTNEFRMLEARRLAWDSQLIPPVFTGLRSAKVNVITNGASAKLEN